MFSAMLQPLKWLQGSPLKQVRKTWYRFQYQRRIRRHARLTALRPMRRLQARTIPAMGTKMRSRKQPASRQPIYNTHIQREESSTPWWACKKPLSKLLKEVQATSRQK